MNTELNRIEVDVREQFPKYCIYKVFDNGTKLMWFTTPVRKGAIRKARELAIQNKVPMVYKVRKKGDK